MQYCQKCHIYFTPGEDESKVFCPACFKPPEKGSEPAKVKKVKKRKKNSGPWAVVYLSVNGPKELARFNYRPAAMKYASSVLNGEILHLLVLKGSKKIRVWKAIMQGESGRVVLPALLLDNTKLTDDDFKEIK